VKAEHETVEKNISERLLELEKALVLVLSENTLLKSENALFKAENRFLRDKIDLLVRRIFGSSSEKLDDSQMVLNIGMDFQQALNEEDGDPDGEPPPPNPPKKRTPKKDRLPDDLPEERITVIPEEVRAAPEAFDCIGAEETVKLDVTPMSFKKIVTVRPKFIRKDRSEAPVIAPAPKQLIAGSFASESLLTRILIGKYVDHLPLYRQEQIFARYDIILSRKTMADWVWRTGDWFRTIYDEIAENLKKEPYLQGDESPVSFLEPGGGKTRKGYLWVYHAPGKGVVLRWHPGRGAECVKEMLDDYDGTLQTDGYAVYPCYNKSRPDSRKLTLACCWAHARRKFHEAKDESALARNVIREVAKLYAIEAVLREDKSSACERKARRMKDSRPILDAIKEMIVSQRSRHLPQSLTGKAISYTLDIWNELNVYVEDGMLEIDNNLIENLIRVPALGKKNWLFFGSKDAGVQSAIIMTVLLNCKMHGINPEEYLKDVLARLPHITAAEARELTPAKWLAARQSKVLTA
jgi:transposase